MESSDLTETGTMRHVVYDRFGERDVLRVTESPIPQPGEGEVLVRVHGAGLNPIDWKTRKGMGFVATQIENRLPWTPGYDAAGEVVEVGEGVTTLVPGHWRSLRRVRHCRR
jgi:NADPH2:quinone reductase